MYLERWIPTWFFLSCKYSLWWSIWDVSDGLFCKFFACSAKYELMKIKLIRSLFIHLSLELVLLKLKDYSSSIATFSFSSPNPTSSTQFRSDYVLPSIRKTDSAIGSGTGMYWNCNFPILKCTGMYWNFKIWLYWKNEIVLESILKCTWISSYFWVATLYDNLAYSAYSMLVWGLFRVINIGK